MNIKEIKEEKRKDPLTAVKELIGYALSGDKAKATIKAKVTQITLSRALAQKSWGDITSPSQKKALREFRKILEKRKKEEEED